MLARLLPLIAPLLVGAAQGLAFRPSSAPIAAWTWVAGAYAICLVIALAYLRSEEALVEQLRYAGGDAARGLLIAAGGLVVVYGASAAAMALLPTLATRELYVLVERTIALPHPWQRALALVAFAAAEELVWRGGVLRALEGRVGSARAGWLAGALYVLSVVPTLRAPMIGAAVVLAVATTLLVRRTGRVLPAIVGHAMFSWLAVDLLLPTLWNGVK